MYGTHRIFTFVLELYPVTSAQGGFYPPDEVIPAQTARNRAALLYVIEKADCPYAVIGQQATYCGGTPQAQDTTTTVASSLNPSDYGQSVKLTATVTASGGVPSGAVTFTEGSTVLASTDFQATATAAQAASLSNAASDGTWSEGSLNAAGLAAINKTGTTQLRIYFNLDDNNDNKSYLGYDSGEITTPGNRPQLVVIWQ